MSRQFRDDQPEHLVALGERGPRLLPQAGLLQDGPGLPGRDVLDGEQVDAAPHRLALGAQQAGASVSELRIEGPGRRRVLQHGGLDDVVQLTVYLVQVIVQRLRRLHVQAERPRGGRSQRRLLPLYLLG